MVIFGPLVVIFGFTLDRKLQLSSEYFWSKFWTKAYPFLFGLIANGLITQCTKLFIGRLRPYFIDVCRPVSTINGSQYDFYAMTDCSMLHNVFITDYECRLSNKSEKLLNMVEQTQMSFFSAHTTLITYSIIYICFLINDRINISNLYSFKILLLYMSLGIFAIWIGYTRIDDHWHHWEDVLVGYLVGVVVAVGIRLIFNNYRRYEACAQTETTNIDQDDNL